MNKNSRKIAVIGAGVAGLTAAYYLSKKHHVTLFEKNHYCGGHANTVSNANDGNLAVDTGFIVFNETNYPNFLNLIRELGVKYSDSDMSFSYSSQQPFFMYSSDFPKGLFGLKRHLISPKFYLLIKEILRFNRQTNTVLSQENLNGHSLQDYLAEYKFSQDLIDYYVIPMGAAIWSASFNETLAMPAKNFLNFWKNHGLLQIKKPKWLTISGGSRQYVNAIKKQFSGQILQNIPISSIKRSSEGVNLYCEAEEPRHFDDVVIATHADEAYQLLADPSVEEKKLLSVWTYSKNHTVFHHDESHMPSRKKCWASWNYLKSTKEDAVSVTYYMNRLQNLNTTKNYFVTLNPTSAVKESHIIKKLLYEHPCFTKESIATQSMLPSLNGKNRTYFCGSYFGNGFHEDAVSAAINVVQQFGVYD